VRNCIIVGSGRSGTSMAAGVLARAGYYMGEQLYPPDAGNPKGYFEDPQINALNEALLAQVLPPRPGGLLGQLFFRARPSDGQRWLAQVPLDAVVPCPDPLRQRIAALTAHQPLCLKDPRFAYTLPAWRPFVADPVLVCVFREPALTAASMLAECRRQPVLRSLAMSRAQALAVWESSYRHILERHHPCGGEWIFLHYNQFLDGSALDTLRTRLGAPVDPSFVDARLKRSRGHGRIARSTAALYRRLCALAGYDPRT
jgi:hypothetical protein